MSDPELAAAPPPPAPREIPIAFTATAGAYFRIWIVNLALTIATVGIYSAWAKVRRKRYFHECTRIEGDGFEYRGNPIAILKGRVVAVGVAATFWTVSHFAPAFLGLVVVAAVFVVPFLLVRSFAFNAYNTAWRNVRFHFGGRYWACWRILLGYGLLTLITLGLGYAFLKTRMTEFLVRHHAFGSTRFEVGNLKKPFFNAYAKMIGLGFLAGAVLGAGMVPLAMATHADPNSPVLWIFNAVFYLMYLGLFAYIRSRIVNHTWNHASVGPVRFRSSLTARGLFGIYLTNILAIGASLGLAAPWAVVRTYRYRAERTVLVTAGTLAGFAAREGGAVNATGEEVAEMMDVDFGL